MVIKMAIIFAMLSPKCTLVLMQMLSIYIDTHTHTHTVQPNTALQSLKTQGERFSGYPLIRLSIIFPV